MLQNIYKSIALLLCLAVVQGLYAQQETECDPTSGLPVAQGSVQFNYGSVTNASSLSNRTNATAGQPIVGRNISDANSGASGIWAAFLLPPLSPFVQATQGDFPDRVQLSWEEDPLGSEAVEGFIITRGGAFLTRIDPGIYEFIDFNVQAGEFYEYAVQGVNQFGNGIEGYDIGFVNPNGVVTGKITTSNGNPVPGAIVTIEPTIGKSLRFDGDGEYVCVSHKDNLPTDMFTVSAWVKIDDTHDSDGIIDLGSDLNKNFWMHTTASGMGKGVVVGIGNGSTAATITHEFVDDANTVGVDERDDWQHVAMVYGGGSLILYINGQFVSTTTGSITNEDALFALGSRRDQTGFFDGWLDDVRIYNRLLSQTEIITTKDITASKNTEGLVAYWKFDEGLGTKVFDISNFGFDGLLTGTTFSSETPNIKNGAITDVTGFYAVDGINYSEEQSFFANPSKIFYDNYALEFNAAYEACATLTNFDLPDTSHIELTVHPFEMARKQSILSKMQGGTEAFELYLENSKYWLTINGETQELGNASAEYQHLALSLNGTTGEVNFYLNGNSPTSLSYANLTGTWDDEAWQLGAKGELISTDFYTGLIDEVAFYRDTLLTQAEVQLNAAAFGNGGTDIGHGGLMVYFDLNEGEGTELMDIAAGNTGFGEVKEAVFSIITLRQGENPHDFEPNARFININTSATSIGNVDFVDISTVAIAGVVRYENTFCFADSTEILVNGAPYFPRIFTDENGRFVADFEPGATVTLTPVFADHEFFPAFFQVRKINRPIAGVLLQDLTKREVRGQVFGGLCRKSIIQANEEGNPLAVVKVKAESLGNTCYEKVIQIDNVAGNYVFKNLPPIPLAIKLVEHSNNVIYDYFQIQGGSEVDLREIEKDTVDFMYISAPNVEIGEISDALNNECTELMDVPVVRESHPTPKLYRNNIRVFQQYEGGKCYLDSFKLVINNGLQESDQENLTSDSTVFVYEYYINNPNLLGDHKKSMQVVAEVNGATATDNYEVIVLGERQKENTILTRAPSKILTIVHDPPGDESSATYSSGKQQCEGWESGNINSFSTGLDLEFKFGQKKAFITGVTIEEAEAVNTTNVRASFESNLTNEQSAEFCWELVNEISTSDGDDIWGQYGDVYYGLAMNFEIGARDVLDYDFENCSFIEDITFDFSPANGDFATEFIYTEWQILTDVIPNLRATQNRLDSLAADRWLDEVKDNRLRVSQMGTPLDTDDVTDTIVTPIYSVPCLGCEPIFLYNDLEIYSTLPEFNAPAFTNITFDAGASYTQSLTNTEERTSSYTYDIAIGAELETEFGFELFGAGTGQTLSFGYSHEFSEQENGSTTNETSTEFTLADDDINDFYSIDIAYDPIYGTPMFKLRGGESMCPWIPGTRNREEVFAQVDNPVAINVPANTPAVFRITLGNIGPNGDDGLVYELGVDEGGNPDGAIIKVDGAPIINPLEFQFLGTSSIEKTITVEYPNTGQFSFEDLGLYFASVCQIEHSESVGYDAGDGGFLIYDEYGELKGQNYYNRFYKGIELDVHFIEPCSPIDIGFPMQNHVINPGEELLNVTLNEYVNTDPDWELMRLQYRPIPGDGAWINILELPATDFANDPVFKIVQWDMMDLRDGDYELRAISQCFDVSLNPGISEVILVTKSTLPPVLLGNPEPADGILNPGDEISITFNKDIRCNEIVQADGIGTNINNNNLGLYDATSGQLIDAIITCRDNKIFIEPNIQDAFIENRTLRVQVEGIKDLNGNPQEEEVVWEFYVNKSNLFWVEGDITEVKEEGDRMIIERTIKNQSGTITNWELENIPDWVNVSPTAGQLVPGDFQTVIFDFSEDMITNQYLETIDLVASDGIEPLNVDMRVVCKGPEWDLDPTQYTYTMNMTLQLNIEGDLSEDNMDRVAAFAVNPDTGIEELRGWAYVQFESSITPPESPDGTYFAFLTLYSNEFSGEDIKLKIWDVSDCILYGQVLEEFTYEADGIIGSPLEPQVVHTVNLISRTIPIHPGWNWISYNVDLPDASINAALETLTNPQSSLIKNQTNFAVYSNEAFVGSLTDMTHRTMYQYRSEALDSIILTGRPIDPDTVPIDILAGWNWIGFLPQQGMPVVDALASLTPLNGDIVKSQIAFAQYVAGTGWIGNLNFMSSPNGYLLKISNDGTLTYPSNSNFTGPAIVDSRNSFESFWEVQPELYQYTMNMIGIVLDDTNLLEDGDEVAAFVNGEIRGHGEVVYLENSESYVIFLTAYANEEGEEMSFQFYDRSTEKVMDLQERFSFTVNAIYGTVDAPEVWTPIGISSTSHLATGETFEVYPNPANERVYLKFNNDVAERIVVRITDALGREVERMETQASTGELILEWQPKDLSDGLYFITLDRADSSVTRKVRITK